MSGGEGQAGGLPRIAALIASRNRPDLVAEAVENLKATCAGDGERYELDVVVVECGTSADKISELASVSYADEPFGGKCVGHNVALSYAQARGEHDYYWVLHNDVRFDGAVDPAATLIDALQSDERMAICSPYNIDGQFPQGFSEEGRAWHAVCVCDYLGFMMRGAALRACGFLNPAFKYCWGAIHELSYKLYRAGWFVAYSDVLGMKHLGGSTYGQKGTGTISRDDYQSSAMRFAYDFFRERYGENWDELFWDAAQGHGIEFNAYTYHRGYWARGFDDEELAQRRGLVEDAAKRCGVRLQKRLRTHDRRGNAAQAQQPAPEVFDEMAALHPWFVPVDLAGVRVVPGAGTEWRADWLSNRIACRHRTMVDGVLERIEMRGKRVLDLACNCAYWSARYAEAGASRVLGIEGRPKHVAQAELYWKTNRFLDAGRFRFELGDVSSDATWEKIAAAGEHDVTLCAGILYHVPDYAEVIRRIDRVTREAIIIDTRVGDETEDLVTEPGDLNFNAIPEALDKRVPHLPRMMALLDELGYDAEVLPADFGAPDGLRNVDDYEAGRRVTVLAVRRVVAERLAPGLVSNDGSVRLHLGCGAEKRDGWVNVDANAACEPDLVSGADRLAMYPDGVVDEIEANHLFEHFTLAEAHAALAEWARVLKPGGVLSLELPSLDGCLKVIGQERDPHGYDMGMIGLFGYPPLIARDGLAQVHKWAWTAQTLTAALRGRGVCGRGRTRGDTDVAARGQAGARHAAHGEARGRSGCEHGRLGRECVGLSRGKF